MLGDAKVGTWSVTGHKTYRAIVDAIKDGICYGHIVEDGRYVAWAEWAEETGNHIGDCTLNLHKFQTPPDEIGFPCFCPVCCYLGGGKSVNFSKGDGLE